MSKYKIGQTVYMGRGENMRELVVADVIDNPMLPVFQYSFEPPNDGFACGEQSIRDTPDGRSYTIGESFKTYDGSESEPDFSFDEASARINTMASGKRHPIMMDNLQIGAAASDVASIVFASSNVFFRPDLVFCKWLKKYANGRLVIDVGAGQGHLVNMLGKVGGHVMGIEPNFDKRMWIDMRLSQNDSMLSFNPNEMIQGTIQQNKSLISGMGDKALLVFARPCHSDFVEIGIKNMPDEMEALYISLPENFDKYDDLGEFKETAVLLDHDGVSEDNENVWSIKKQ